jgi:hypothetical protein
LSNNVLALSLFFLRRASTGGDGVHKTPDGAHAITATVKDTIDTSLNQECPLPQTSLTRSIAWRVDRYSLNRVNLPPPRELERAWKKYGERPIVYPDFW